MVEIEVRGESLGLLVERAVYWKSARTVIVADVHLGKAATFRAHAIPLPEGNMDADLDRLGKVVETTNAERLIVLGDLIHAAVGRDEYTLNCFKKWRNRHQQIEIVLVRGNHDKGAGDPPAEWRITCLDGPVEMAPFVLNHVPFTPDQGYGLAGHIHPGVILAGKAQQMLKLPCFWFGDKCGVLPAFGSLTGVAAINAGRTDRVYVVGETSVIPIRP